MQVAANRLLAPNSRTSANIIVTTVIASLRFIKVTLFSQRIKKLVPTRQAWLSFYLIQTTLSIEKEKTHL